MNHTQKKSNMAAKIQNGCQKILFLVENNEQLLIRDQLDRYLTSYVIKNFDYIITNKIGLTFNLNHVRIHGIGAKMAGKSEENCHYSSFDKTICSSCVQNNK